MSDFSTGSFLWKFTLATIALSGCCLSSTFEGTSSGMTSTSTGTTTVTSSGGSTSAGTTSGACTGRGPSAASGASSPGGHCTSDADCPGCGWVCSQALAGICVPAMTGDPGSCIVDTDCACRCQSCGGGHCVPAAHPQCACNSDCPAGDLRSTPLHLPRATSIRVVLWPFPWIRYVRLRLHLRRKRQR